MNCRNCKEPKCGGACGTSVSPKIILGPNKYKDFVFIKEFLNNKLIEIASKKPEIAKEIMDPKFVESLSSFENPKEAYMALRKKKDEIDAL
jgi:hypothetical protein